MAAEKQAIEEIPVGALLESVQRMRARGWRLVQVSCTRLVADQEVNYSFDRGPASVDPSGAAAATAPRLVTLRVRVPVHGAELPSISPFYWSAFLYENEMHDLFGVTVHGMAVDFKGKLYTTLVPTPFVAPGEEHGD
jgi:ech hydrogenase subunit D